MKKSLLILSLAVIIATPAFSNGIFDFSSKSEEAEIEQVDLKPNSYAPAASVNLSGVNTNTDTKEKIRVSSAGTTQNQNNLQDTNYQNAIQNLDAAQAGLREELINYNKKYSEAKARYDANKEECSALRKQIRTIERKIKSLERTKNNIGKNLTENL